MKSYEEHESTVVYPSGMLFKSKSAAAIAAATRSVIGLWAQQPRVCVCPPEVVREADRDGGSLPVVVHKRRGQAHPASQFVTMPAWAFVELLKAWL